MKIYLNSCYQMEDLVALLNRKIVNLCRAHDKTVAIRFLGLGVGCSFALIQITQRIAMIAENIFKGFLNITGAPFFKQCRLKNGLKFTFILIPKNVLILALLVPLSLIIIVICTIWLAKNPASFSGRFDKRYNLNHEDELKNHATILGLDVNKKYTEAEIKKTAKRLRILYHPDKNKAPGAEAKFKAVGVAMESILESKMRTR